MKHVALNKLSTQERKKASVFLGEIFGVRADQDDLILAWQKDQSRVGVVFFLDEKIVGLGVARSIVFAEKDSPYIRFPFQSPQAIEAKKILCDEDHVGALQILAVAKNKRNHGIGRRVALHLVQALRERDVRFLVGVCWDNGSKQTSKPLFITAGFQEITSSCTFFADENKKNGQHCLHCRPQSCSCNALLFFKALHEEFTQLLASSCDSSMVTT